MFKMALLVMLFAVADDKPAEKASPPAATTDATAVSVTLSTEVETTEKKLAVATDKAAKAAEKRTAAKEAFEQADRESKEANDESARAYADYRVAVMKDFTERARKAKEAADRATSEARAVGQQLAVAEKEASQALAKAGIKSAPEKPVVRNDQVRTDNTNLEDFLPVQTGSKLVSRDRSPVNTAKIVERPRLSIKTAVLTLIVPPAAKVSINGTSTNQTGRERTFETEQLPLDRTYDFVIVVDVNGNKTTRTVPLRGGSTVTEDFLK